MLVARRKAWKLWTPADITTQAWYDAADAATIEQSSGLVSQWSDKSGNSNHATQSNNSYKPLTGGSINGLNAITGNTAPGYAYMNVANNDTVKSCFAVFDVSTDPGLSTSLVIVLGANAVDGTCPEAFVRYDSDQVSFDGWPGACTGKYSLNGGADSSVAANFTDAAVRTGINFIEMVTTASFGLSGLLGRNVSNVGPAQVFKVGEIVWFDTELSTANKQLVEGYLAWKWGLQANLPVSHPFAGGPPRLPMAP